MADLGEIIKRHEADDPMDTSAHLDRAALIALLKEAHEALKPFAEAKEMFAWPVYEPDGYKIREGTRLTVADLRQAARILAGTE